MTHKCHTLTPVHFSLFVSSGHLMLLQKFGKFFSFLFVHFPLSIYLLLYFCACSSRRIRLYICATTGSPTYSKAECWKNRNKNTKKLSTTSSTSLVKIEIGKMSYKYFARINRCVVKLLRCNEIMPNPNERQKINWPIKIVKFSKIKPNEVCNVNNFHQLVSSSIQIEALHKNSSDTVSQKHKI